MASLLRINQFNSLVLSSLLLAFPLAVLAPSSVHSQINIGFNDVNFGVNIQKLIDKAWKYYDKEDSDSLVDVLLDIKNEIETHRGITINLEKEIDKVEAHLKKKGHKAPKKVFENYKNLLKKKEKKNHHRFVYMESFLLEAPDMNFYDYEMLHLATTKNEKEESSKDPLPFKFVLGVSLVLCGAFTMFATPVCPIFGPAGETLMLTGFGFLVDQGVEIYQKEY